jgi:hypothetical protein
MEIRLMKSWRAMIDYVEGNPKEREVGPRFTSGITKKHGHLKQIRPAS